MKSQRVACTTQAEHCFYANIVLLLVSAGEKLFTAFVKGSNNDSYVEAIAIYKH